MSATTERKLSVLLLFSLLLKGNIACDNTLTNLHLHSMNSTFIRQRKHIPGIYRKWVRVLITLFNNNMINKPGELHSDIVFH